jgi:hypothetical protein
LVEIIEAPVALTGGGISDRVVCPPAGMVLNFAAAAARGELLAFVRGDLLPEPTWAEAIAAALAGRSDPLLLTGDTVGPDGPVTGPLHCALSAESLQQVGGFAEAVPYPCVAGRPAGGLEGQGLETITGQPGMRAVATAALDAARSCGRFHVGRAPSPFLGPPSPGLVGPCDRTRPAASVIVPVHGRPTWLAFCMEALRRQDMTEPYEVLLAAECPEEAMKELRQSFRWARVIRCAPGLGPGGQRNCAVAEARGDYIVLTDDDCVADRDWLRTMVESCRSRGGRVTWGWVSTAYPWDVNSRALNVSENGQLRPGKPVSTQGVGGGNMCVRRALVLESGARFAERVYGAEEMTFLTALPEQAKPVLHEPGALVRHLRNDDFTGSLARQYRLGHGSGRVRSRLRIRGSLAARWPFLAPLLAPTRYLLAARRVLLESPLRLGAFLRLSPLMALHHACYAAGFAVGALTAGRGRSPGSRL